MGALTCVGLTTLDVVQVVDRLPGPDQKVVATDGWVSFGGPAANAAATAVALGVPAVLVSAVGAGPVAELARAGLAARGVRLVDLAPDLPDLLAVSSVLATGSTGERSVVSRNATAAPDLAAGALELDLAGLGLTGPGDVLLADGHHLTAAVALAGRARRAGVRVLLDGGSWKPGLDRLLAQVDLAVLSGDLVLPGGARPVDDDEVDELLAAVARLGPAVVARSAGAGPVRVRLASGRSVNVPVPAVARVVDTLGAGDVLHGAIAAALVGGGFDDAAVLAAVQVGVRRARGSVAYRGALGWVDARPR
jgi:sugar/nucleoside kinase (ribokinase family)